MEMVFGLDRELRGSDNWKLPKKKKDVGDYIVYKILIFHFRASRKEGKEKSLLSVSPMHQFTQVGTAEPQLLSERAPLKVGLSPRWNEAGLIK